MKKEEIKITSFQAENYRLQLLYVTKEMKNGTIKKVYEIRENRKLVFKTFDYNTIKNVYARCINDKLNTNIITSTITKEPKTISWYKIDNKYIGKYELTHEEAKKYIDSDKYIKYTYLGDLYWEKE